MLTLSLAQKNEFRVKINHLKSEIERSRAASTLAALERFEAQLTLNELEECFLHAPPEDFNTQITAVLNKRWERIQGSCASYTAKPFGSVNQLVLELAMTLSPITPSEINVLEANTGPYFLLMPTVEKGEDIYRNFERPRPPRGILPRIFKLSTSEQKMIFKQANDKNALTYTLTRNSDALIEFELDAIAKKEAIQARIKPDDETGLMIAARHGKINVIKLLLHWGADIAAQDNTGWTALHYAAVNGQVNLVHYLIEKNFPINAVTRSSNTALHLAIAHEKSAVAKVLLEKSDLTLRNASRWNALDIALNVSPEILVLILMRISTLSPTDQRKHLRTMHNCSYPNIFFYAADQNLSAFYKLMQETLSLPNHPLRETLIQSKDDKGWTTLHWAAANGDLSTISRLLEEDADLEALSDSNHTPLHLAIINGQKPALALLFKKSDASSKKHALAVAHTHRSMLIADIVKHIATLPSAAQTACLAEVPNGPYPNIYFYAATINSNLLRDLLDDHSQLQHSLKLRFQDLYQHLYDIGAHYQIMKRKASSNPNYNTAVDVAETLLKTCIDALLTVHENNDSPHENLWQFKTHCRAAISNARPILKEYRGWGKIIAAFLLDIISLPLGPLCSLGIFSLKTKSEQLLDHLEVSMERLS